MDFRAVFIFLCLLTMQALCGTIKNGVTKRALNTTFQFMRNEIQGALEHLINPELLPTTIPCPPLNISNSTEQHLIAHQLSSFGSRLIEVSKLTPELSEKLEVICQIIQDAEQFWTEQPVPKNYSLLSFKQDIERYVYAKCLLQRMDKWLSEAKF